MATAREIHRHMKSVGNIGKITKAMKMVAAARLRRAQEKAAASRPYAIKIKEVLSSVVSDPSILAGLSAKKHPLLQHREVKKVGYLVLASDKGLAGAYSSNALKLAVAEISACDDEVVVITSGRKARDFFNRRGYKVLSAHSVILTDLHMLTLLKLLKMQLHNLLMSILMNCVLYIQFLKLLCPRLLPAKKFCR